MKRRGSTERWIIAQIRKLVHPYCFGKSDRFKANFEQTTKKQILDFYGALRLGLSRRFLPRLKTSDYMMHFAGSYILYFQADGRRKTPETLIMIDIDCHDRGTREGAVRCVEWLKEHGFPNLFWCRSTNGRGIHAYVIVKKQMINDVELDRALVSLERWLQYQHQAQGWDIELIEVKGRPPICEWGNAKYELLNVKMGAMGKVPIDLLDRPEEFLATTRMGIARMLRLGSEVPREWDAKGYRSARGKDDLAEVTLDEIRQWVPESGSGVWCQFVEKMARIGLIDDDSMGSVVFELSKWLLHVELFNQDDALEIATELLQSYVLNKHNGHISRLNEGREREVLSQVERIVASAVKVSQESDELFGRIREGRENGKYRRQIRIVPLLREESKSSGAEDTPYTCSTYYCLPLREDPLPQSIENKLLDFARSSGMRRSQGEFPFLRFSRRLLNLLSDKGGSARLSTAFLTTLVSNVHQQDQFKKTLRSLGLLKDWTGTYRSKSVSSLYSLTGEAISQLGVRQGEHARKEWPG